MADRGFAQSRFLARRLSAIADLSVVAIAGLRLPQPSSGAGRESGKGLSDGFDRTPAVNVCHRPSSRGSSVDSFRDHDHSQDSHAGMRMFLISSY